MTLPIKCGLGLTTKALKKVTFSLDLVKESIGGENFKKQPKVVALKVTWMNSYRGYEALVEP